MFWVGEAHPLNNLNTVTVIPLQEVRTHECKDWQHILNHLVREQRSDVGYEKQSLVRCLGVIRDCVGSTLVQPECSFQADHLPRIRSKIVLTRTTPPSVDVAEVC